MFVGSVVDQKSGNGMSFTKNNSFFSLSLFSILCCYHFRFGLCEAIVLLHFSSCYLQMEFFIPPRFPSLTLAAFLIDSCDYWVGDWLVPPMKVFIYRFIVCKYIARLTSSFHQIDSFTGQLFSSATFLRFHYYHEHIRLYATKTTPELWTLKLKRVSEIKCSIK